MDYFEDYGYSLKPVASALSEDKNMLNFLVENGSELNIVGTSSQALDMFISAFRDESINHYTVSSIFRAGISYQQFHPDHCISLENSIALIEQLRDENIERLNDISPYLCLVIGDRASGKKNTKIVGDALLLLLENADSEVVADVIGRKIYKLFHDSKTFLTQSFPVFLSIAEKLIEEYSHIAEDFERCKNLPPQAGGQGQAQYDEFFISSFINIVNVIITPSVYATLLQSPVSCFFPMNAYLAKVDGVETIGAFDKINEEGLDYTRTRALQVAVGEGEMLALYTRVFEQILEDETYIESHRRLALSNIIKNDHNCLKKNMAFYEACLATDYVHETERNTPLTIEDLSQLSRAENETMFEFYRRHAGTGLIDHDRKTGKITAATCGLIESEINLIDQLGKENKYQISSKGLSNCAGEFGPPELLPDIYNNASLYGRTVSETQELKMLIMERITRDASQWEINAELTAKLWGCAQSFSQGDEYELACAKDVMVTLIRTNTLSNVLLEDATKMCGRIAKTAEIAIAEKDSFDKFTQVSVEKVSETISEADGDLSTSIHEGTNFTQYLRLTTLAGYTPIAGLGLYATDTRIKLVERTSARKDFIAFLKSAPEYALDVPESVWVGMLKVRKPLDLGMGLVAVMNDLGFAAAKVVSKNLTNAAFL